MRALRPSGEATTAERHAPRIEIRVLGPLEVRVDDRAVGLPGPKDRGLLGILAVHANRVVPLADLARELWDGEVPERAGAVVHVYLSHLRSALTELGVPSDRLTLEDGGYRLRLTEDELDATRFARLVGEGRARSVTDEEGAADTLREALGLWRGTVLADAGTGPAAVLERRRLEALREQAANLLRRCERPAHQPASAPSPSPAAPARPVVTGDPATDAGGIVTVLFAEVSPGALVREAAGNRGVDDVRDLGDGLLVVFASALDGVACAADVLRAGHALGAAGRDDVRVRMGLHVGERRALRNDGTGGVGNPVVAARELCGRAQPGEAVVSDLVRALVGTRGGFQFEDNVAAVDDAGVASGLVARTLAWSPPADAPALPLPGPIGHLPAVFVGRRSELAEIDGVLTQLGSGERRAVLVSGEPGIGKTSLVGQFARQAHGAGANVFYGRCDEETLVPYQPFVEAFARYAEVRPAEHLDAELGRHRAELARLVPRLEAEAAGFGMASEDVELDRYRMFEAVAAVLGTLSRARPTVLVLDDLHWADTPTLLLLRHLARHGTPTSLLILGTYRDTDLSRSHPLSQFLADLRRDQLVTRVHLSGLSLDDVVALLAETAGREVGPPDRELGNTLWRETDGNPYFVGEIVQHLTETGALDGIGGRWPRGLGVDGGIIPEGVKEVIGRRLSRLSEPANRCLRIASVMGREFGVEELTAVVELPADDVLDALDEAAHAGLVAEQAESTGRYEFCHMLLRQTLYGELTTARRLRLHRRIGEVLEVLHGEHLDRHLAELARHFFEAAPAGEVDKAMDYAIRAGDRAMTQLAFEAAGRLYGMALDTADDADVGPEARCDVLLRLGDAEWRAGDGVTARALFERAFALARQARDPERLGRAALGFAGAGVRMWWVDVGIVNQKLIDMFEDALGALPTDDGELRARLMGVLAQELYFVAGSRARRDQLSSDAVAMARRVGHQPTLAHVLANRNLAIFGPDNVEEGLEIGTEVVALGTALANREMVAYGHGHRFMAHMQLGDVASAYREFELGSQLLDELRQPAYQQIRVIAQTMKAQTSGRLDEADALAREAFALGQETRDPNAALILANQMYAILRDRGELEVLYGSLAPFAEFYPTLPGLRAMLALASKELGNDEDARRQLEILGADGYAALPRDFLWLATMCQAAEVCGAVGNSDAAAQLYELLTPHAGRNALQPFGSLGSTSSALGILAGVLGRYDEAERHFADAIDMNTRLGADHLVARTRAQHAEMLLRRDGGGGRVAPRAAPGRRRTVGRHARAALTTRGRNAMARLLRDATDDDLVRRFSSPVAQRALFALIARSFDAHQARGFEGDLVYELVDADDPIGATSSWWTLEVRGRRATSRRGTSTDAVLVVHIGLAAFIRLIAGELHPITALTRGLCRIDGDVMLGGRLVEMFGGGLPVE
jgi:hypothetical protein